MPLRKLALRAGLELLLGVQRELDHALEELVVGRAGEVAQHQLFDVEPHEIAQLQRAIARREDEIAVAAVDDMRLRSASKRLRQSSPAARSNV